MKYYFNTSYYKMLLIGTAIASCQGAKHHRAHSDKRSDNDERSDIKHKRQRSVLKRLPPEWLCDIMKFLPTDELIAVSQVDSRIHALIKREVDNKYNRHKKPYEIDGSNQANFEKAIRVLKYFEIGHVRYRIMDKALSSSHIVALSKLPFVKSVELIDNDGDIANFLNLSCCNIDDEQLNHLLTILKNPSNLEWLYLHNNKLTKFEWNLPNLRYLSLSNNRIKKFSRNFPELLSLDLNENQIEEFSGNLPRLTSLYLGANQIETFPEFILNQYPQLRALYLHNNQIKKVEMSVPHLGLRILYLSNNAIESFSGLENLPQLRELHLEQNKLTTLDGLEALPELDSLFLEKNKIATIEAVVAGLANLQQLLFLDLANNQLTDGDIDELRQRYPNICIKA